MEQIIFCGGKHNFPSTLGSRMTRVVSNRPVVPGHRGVYCTELKRLQVHSMGMVKQECCVVEETCN